MYFRKPDISMAFIFIVFIVFCAFDVTVEATVLFSRQ